MQYEYYYYYYKIDPPMGFRDPLRKQNVARISGILKLIMVDGWPFKYVKFHQTSKCTSKHIRCVCAKLNKSSTGFRDLFFAPETRTDGRRASRTSEDVIQVTPTPVPPTQLPNEVGAGAWVGVIIKINDGHKSSF